MRSFGDFQLASLPPDGRVGIEWKGAECSCRRGSPAAKLVLTAKTAEDFKPKCISVGSRQAWADLSHTDCDRKGVGGRVTPSTT